MPRLSSYSLHIFLNNSFFNLPPSGILIDESKAKPVRPPLLPTLGRSRERRHQPWVEIISASAETDATPANGEYHSRAARPGLINQVVETVALVRSSVADVYYRNDSMTVGRIY
jgi:hypothetical protein